MPIELHNNNQNYNGILFGPERWSNFLECQIYKVRY